MSSYRLDFIRSLAAPTTTKPPRYTVIQGGAFQLQQAHAMRVRRMYLVLLTEAGVQYRLDGPDSLVMVDGPESADLIAQLWNDANVLVRAGRDLQ